MVLLAPDSSPQSDTSLESGCHSPEATNPTMAYEKGPKHTHQTRRPNRSKEQSMGTTTRKSKGGASGTSLAPSKVAHNLVERKYRDTLNTELERLRQAVPHMAALGERASKAAILASAVGYISRLEAELARLGQELGEERESVEAASKESCLICGRWMEGRRNNHFQAVFCANTNSAIP